MRAMWQVWICLKHIPNINGMKTFVLQMICLQARHLKNTLSCAHYYDYKGHNFNENQKRFTLIGLANI